MRRRSARSSEFRTSGKHGAGNRRHPQGGSRMPPPSKTFRSRVVLNGSASFIPLTFDPKPVFGKVRAPVKVMVTGHTFRSTIAAMGGPPFIPFRRSNREAAGLEGGEAVTVTLVLDIEERVVQ